MTHTSPVIPTCGCLLKLDLSDTVNIGDTVKFPNGWEGRVVQVLGPKSAMVSPYQV